MLQFYNSSVRPKLISGISTAHKILQPPFVDNDYAATQKHTQNIRGLNRSVGSAKIRERFNIYVRNQTQLYARYTVDKVQADI